MEKEIENIEKDLYRLYDICQLQNYKPTERPVVEEQCGIIEKRLVSRIYQLSSNTVKNKLEEALKEHSQN